MINLVVTAVTIYLMVVALAAVMQRSLMYVPSHDWVVNPATLPIEFVQYKTTDGLELQSWYAAPKSATMPVFVLFHGNGGNISDHAFKLEYFHKQGYGFLLAEYRGYGPNPGSPSETGFYNDARAAISWLMKEKGIDESRLIFLCHSLGCGVASQMALEFPKVKAFILEAPFTSGVNIAGDVYPWLGPFKHLTLDKYDNIAKAPSFTMPVLIISGDRDSVIPHRHSEELLKAIGSPQKQLITLAGADHNNMADFGLLPAIQKFIETK